MHRVAALGAALLVAGLVGYTVGIETAYPGRSFSVTAVMVGIGLLAVGRSAPEVTP
jgi:hypothetical protein